MKPKHMSSLLRLLVTAAVVTLPGVVAYAQSGAPETVTVTGTNIRGAAPVGTNVINVDRSAIDAEGAQTVEQIMQDIPQLSGFGDSGVGAIGAGGDASATSSPDIHNLCGSPCKTTLILIDGHRAPLSGLNHTIVDPSIVPSAAVASVDVLASGASAVYGSDATAGVINVITRKNFNGMKTSVQYGMADHYSTFDVSQIMGATWQGGSAMAVWDLSSRSELMNRDRSYVGENQATITAAAKNTVTNNAGTFPAGTNLSTFDCSPASIRAASGASTSLNFVYPYTGASLSNVASAQQGVCGSDGLNAGVLLPGELRDTGLLTLRQEFGGLLLGAMLDYSDRMGSSQVSRGTLTASSTAFGPGSPTTSPAGGPQQVTGTAAYINPFFVGNSTTGNGSEVVTYDFNQLLGPGAYTKTGAQSMFVNVTADYDLGAWHGAFIGTYGTDTAFSRSLGIVNAGEALLALNGTTKTNGATSTTATTSSLADPYGLNSIDALTRPLTTANALDVWDPATTNKTSPDVLRSLVDSATNNMATNTIQDNVLKFDGPIFTLPAGDLKAAIGGEYIYYTLDQFQTTAGAAGPSSTTSNFTRLRYNRSVESGFAELNVPIISPAMNIPLVQKLDFSASGRYDNYSDFGDTFNPKIGFTWKIVDGIQVRGSYDTSFTAPALTSIGQPGTGLTGETNVRVGGVPNGAVFIPGNGLNGTWSASALAGTFCAAGCTINTATQPGIQINGGDSRIKPYTGLDYNAGFDIDFGALSDSLEGLTTNVSWWFVKVQGLITAASFAADQVTPYYQNVPNVYFAPTAAGWSPTDPFIQKMIAGRPLTAALPAAIFTVFDFRQENNISIEANGFDYSTEYTFNNDWGHFNAGTHGSLEARFDYILGGLSPAPKWTNRFDAGWSDGGYSLQLFVNFVSAHSVTNTNSPYNVAGPNRSVNLEHISANWTADMHASYHLPEEWWSGAEVDFTINNLFDKAPPYDDTTIGAEANTSATSNPIGRMFIIGVKKTW